MKKIIIISILLCSSFAYAQNEPFRLDTDLVALYNIEEDNWTEWVEGNNTFAFNINENGDVLFIKANGEKVLFRRLSEVEEGVSDNGLQQFQLLKVLDEKGNIILLKLYDDKSLGVQLIYEDYILQFSKSNS